MPDYERIRSVLAPQYRNLSAEQLEDLFASAALDAAELEESMELFGGLGSALSSAGRSIGGALGQAGQVAAKMAPQVLPGVAQGAMAGSAFGPWGTVIGGLAGGIGSALSQPSPAAPPPPPPGPTYQPGPPRPSYPSSPALQPSPITGMTGSVAQSQAGLGSLLGGMMQSALAPQLGGSSAAAQLLGVLARPETLQALMSMVLGSAGRSNVRVGGSRVPTGAFANLLGTLAGQAGLEYAASTRAQHGHFENVPGYLRAFDGEAYGDVANPEYRAAVLLELLQEADEQFESDEASPMDFPEMDDRYYDELDLAGYHDYQ